jgi:membrane-bound serine protease (ClpP class)
MFLRRSCLFCLLFATAAVIGQKQADAADQATAPPSLVVHLRLDDQAITPATVRFMRRGIRNAAELKAECIVIEINTPGGVLQSTQEFVVDMLASKVPIVVYVSPSGARAASAGVFITLASHVAAMAPGTRIGAAHPVAIGGLPFSPPQPPQPTESPATPDEKSDDTERKTLTASEQKLVNDTVAWAKSLAELRGRNAQWAAQSVSESDVLVATEAVELRVVDLEASDLHDLLRKIDGKEIELSGPNGTTISTTLQTADATLHEIEMWWGEQLLAVISDPNVSLLLMLFGVYGIIFEFYSPGWGVAGTLGVVSLVLGFFGLSVLPVNYSGLALILIALALFVAEAFVTSYGALAIGGVACLILGGTMLVDSPTGFLHVSLEILVPVAVATAIVTVFLVSRIVKAQRSRVQTGSEAMIGLEAVAQNEFVVQDDAFAGQVQVHGEFWRALSPRKIAQGQHVRVEGREGLTLKVDRNGRSSVDIETNSSTEGPKS